MRCQTCKEVQECFFMKTKTVKAPCATLRQKPVVSTLLRFGFYDNRDNRDNGLIVNSMLYVDNNKNNFYQPKGWLPLDTTFTFVMDNALLHPGCRCALPWAMFFCAYSACWSIYFLRTSSPRIEMVERLPQPKKYFMPCAYGSRRLRQRQSR